MILGKYINRYYVKYAGRLLFGLLALFAVDYLQLLIPNLYQMVINGVNEGQVLVDGQMVAFDLDFLLDRICMPMVGIILMIVLGRCAFWARPSRWRPTCGRRCSTTPRT